MIQECTNATNYFINPVTGERQGRGGGVDLFALGCTSSLPVGYIHGPRGPCSSSAAAGAEQAGRGPNPRPCARGAAVATACHRRRCLKLKCLFDNHPLCLPAVSVTKAHLTRPHLKWKIDPFIIAPRGACGPLA